MADDQDRRTSFGIGDLFSKIKSEGLPANARAYLETAASHVFDLPNPTFGSEFFTEAQLELLREGIRNRTSDEVTSSAFLDPSLKSYDFKSYRGPLAEKLGIGSLLEYIYNDIEVLSTSLGGFTVREDDKNYYISDDFDFVGVPMSVLESVKDASARPSSFAYRVLRNWASKMSSESYPDDKPPPVFKLTIPKEGPISGGAEKRAHGGFIDKPLYDRNPYG